MHTKQKGENKMEKEEELYAWCIKQARDRRDGHLNAEQIKKLDSIGFPWKQYEQEIKDL